MVYCCTEMAFERQNILIVVVLTYCICYANSHPQCLDFRPPFKPSERLEFCVTYGEYGCCDSGMDEALSLNHKYISDRAKKYNDDAKEKSRLDGSCLHIIKDLICLECHPYAAHVFDTEDIINDAQQIFKKRNVRLPGLCKHFCLANFDRCKTVISDLATTNSFYEFVNTANASTFCSWAQISDKGYCYPNVNNVSISKEKIVLEHRDKLCVEPISGPFFANALAAVHSNDKSHRLFVAEQRGLVFILFPNGTKLETPFLNITKRVVNSGTPWDERGFLGLSFHPKYKENGQFYVYYSAPAKGLYKEDYSHYKWYWGVQHRIRVSEFTVDPLNPNMADHDSELPLLEINQPEPNHNGGMLLFGEDGYLYIFVGDGGGSGDRHGIHGNGLSMSTFLGKVLRIDVDSDDEIYEIPKDNPFIDYGNVKHEIFAIGVRNIWRCSIDREKTDRMFCGDVGQNRYEEINIIKKGRNYGWRAYEGFSCFDIQLCNKKLKNLEFPILTYGHDIGRSIVGGYVYRGCDNPNMYGRYFFADTMTGRIFSASENSVNQNWEYREVAIGDGKFCNNGLNSRYHSNILSFGESESGEIYILSTPRPHPHFQSSVVYRLVDPLRRADPDQCKFEVNEAKPLKRIKRRSVFEKYKKTREKEEMELLERRKMEKICKDTGSFCTQFKTSEKRKKPLLDCKKSKHLSKKFCKLTCGFCSLEGEDTGTADEKT